MVIPIRKEEVQKRPDVKRALCCKEQTGVLVDINGVWWLLRNSESKGGQMASNAFLVAICRGCYCALTPETPTTPWPWGTDEQLEEHFQQIARETSSKKKGE